MTVVDHNEVRARDIKYDEILWARARTRTRRSRVAKLITVSKVLKRVFIEEFAVPPLDRKSVV